MAVDVCRWGIWFATHLEEWIDEHCKGANEVEPTINYEDVREYVESLPEGEIAGRCREAGKCLVAETLNKKYPEYEAFVTYRKSRLELTATLFPAVGEYVDVRVEDEERLTSLAVAFDKLGLVGQPVTKEETLELLDPCIRTTWIGQAE